jgi:hypothetical protein
MSDQSGAISDLEELFLAREFGLPSGRHLRAVEEDLGEAPEPRELEEVFGSRDFGRPVALELLEGGDDEPAPNVVEFPFAGPGAKPLDRAVRQRAVAALSGVAAAALVIAGLASAGGHTGRADVAALAHQSTPNGATAVAPNVASAVPSLTTASDGASLAGVTTGFGGSTSSGGAGAAPSVALASLPVTTSSGGSGPASGGTPTSTPAPGGGSTGLAPVTSVVGTSISTAGSSVSAASGTVASAIPTAPTFAGTMSQTGHDVSVLGQSLVASPAG